MKKKIKLDKEEQDLLESFERGEWQSSNPTPSEVRKFQKIARTGLTKDRRINIRIPSRVLEGLQLRAIEEGVPYQTFISSVLYKFASGRLVPAYNNAMGRRQNR